MTYLIINVTGAKLLEKSMKNKKPGYDEYVASTPQVFPRPSAVLRKLTGRSP